MITLYDYQLDAIRKMHNGCILCGGLVLVNPGPPLLIIPWEE